VGTEPRILKTLIMKNLKLITGLLVFALFFRVFRRQQTLIWALDAPQNISALTTVTQDNTGRLLLPRGEGVTQYEILWRRNFCACYASPGGIVEQHTRKEL
jgi:hypothetical protein